MAFADLKDQWQGIELLQRSLRRGRLGHAYLFSGDDLDELTRIAKTLAKTLNCLTPVKSESGVAIDCCDACINCRKIEEENHGDIHWVRPESKSRIITIDQMRDLMQQIHLRPNDAEYKVSVIVAADRLNVQSANAFLKTLEEPPSKSILILLTTDPQRILETILSRCLRLNFGGESAKKLREEHGEWLQHFGELAAEDQKSLISRYRLLGALLKRLGEIKAQIETTLTARSPLERFDDVDSKLRERWEEELAAAIEAEYRRRRAEVLAALQWWLRDVWIQTQSAGKELLNFPDLVSAGKIAARLNSQRAQENLQVMERTQRLLQSNVQEALALEVGLLKLHL